MRKQVRLTILSPSGWLGWTGLVVLGLLAPIPALSQTQEEGGVDWTLRFYGVLMDADYDEHLFQDGQHDTIRRNDEGVGLGFGAEARLSPLIGLEITNIIAGLDDDDVYYRDDEYHYDHDREGVFVLLGGINFHLVHTENFDLHLGPHLGIAATGHDDCDNDWFDDCDDDHSDVDGSAVVGLNLGFEFALGKEKNWALYMSAKGLGSFDDDDNDRRHNDRRDFDLDEEEFSFFAIGASYTF